MFSAAAPVFQSVRRPGSPLTERAVNFILKEAAERASINRAASIHWLRHARVACHRQRGDNRGWLPG